MRTGWHSICRLACGRYKRVTMNLLWIAWGDNGEIQAQALLRDGNLSKFVFHWRRADVRGSTIPNVIDIDQPSAQGARALVRAGVGFAGASFELGDILDVSGVNEIPWSDGVRLEELRLEGDSLGEGTLVSQGGESVRFFFDIPRGFGQMALSEFPAIGGELVTDPAHRAAISEAVEAFQVAAGPPPL